MIFACYNQIYVQIFTQNTMTEFNLNTFVSSKSFNNSRLDETLQTYTHKHCNTQETKVFPFNLMLGVCCSFVSCNDDSSKNAGSVPRRFL